MQRLMRTSGKALLLLLGLSVGAYAAYAYGFLPLGSVVHPESAANFRAHSLGISIHVFASIFAIVLGPLQFSTRLRRSHLSIHRWIGRSYLVIGVLIGGLSGLYMATLAYGGTVPRVGFALLATVWLYSGYRAYSAIRQRRIEEHRRWMVRNYALTFAAVTLRIYLPLGMLAQLPFDTVYATVAWICWIPNLLVVEWFLRRRGTPAAPLAELAR
jgi:uncharacterized membrane protein